MQHGVYRDSANCGWVGGEQYSCFEATRSCSDLENLKFVEVRQKGSHKQFRHEDGRATTVPFHKGRDISPKLLRQIASDIELAIEEMLKMR
ncbi:type II toxin-antitoxin system HicA family toxin [Phormidesmis priestleyi]|uniref:type II toxin-antitoxin system HicA family toxin n=1 Tax=Phormidesmis priestleyi TaxID=268141 RepID=UPI0022B24DE8|nr:type II toxin-antitoxin system HicA family toxin [Phormidesmis priestleyi]